MKLNVSRLFFCALLFVVAFCFTGSEVRSHHHHDLLKEERREERDKRRAENEKRARNNDAAEDGDAHKKKDTEQDGRLKKLEDQKKRDDTERKRAKKVEQIKVDNRHCVLSYHREQHPLGTDCLTPSFSLLLAGNTPISCIQPTQTCVEI